MGGGTVEERPYLTIVIPVYNESRRLPENLPKVVAYLEGQAYPWEIIIVDDGSEDDTADIAEGFQREEQRISLLKNPHQGKAYAVRTGVLAARGENVFHCDVDLSMPIQELGKLLPPLSGGYDLSIGSRTVRHNFPWHRRLMSWGFRQIVRLFIGAGFKDTQCGFKCYRTEAAKDLFHRTRLYSVAGATVKGPAVTGFDVEVLFLAVKRGYKVKEVPVEWYYSRDSKVNPIKDSLRNLRDVLQVRLNDWRGLYGR
ncbi:MAG: glycosyltransferase family 2 protein [Chloroflexi bacterium]|nr:glycosyltransferase family 2 protein [Chloroflexota bacterium]